MLPGFMEILLYGGKPCFPTSQIYPICCGTGFCNSIISCEFGTDLTDKHRPTRITGMKSGLKAAGQEFVYGVYGTFFNSIDRSPRIVRISVLDIFYVFSFILILLLDGCSGLVLQPYHGAKENGAVGFVKGVGMGFTGFVLKDLAAIFGPFAYTLKGAHKEMLKSKQPTNFIRKARIMQGQRDLKLCSEAERKKALDRTDHGWDIIQQFWAIMEENKRQGLRGRAMARKERKLWKENGAFENIEMAEKTLEARKKDQSLEGTFTQQKEESKVAEKPQRSVLKDVQEGDKVDDFTPEDPKVLTEIASEGNGYEFPKRRATKRKQTV
jgi:hypothetical protein